MAIRRAMSRFDSEGHKDNRPIVIELNRPIYNQATVRVESFDRDEHGVWLDIEHPHTHRPMRICIPNENVNVISQEMKVEEEKEDEESTKDTDSDSQE